METPMIGLLRQAMAAYATRMRALAANVANLDTPGYQRVEVAFEEQLSRARRLAPSRADPADVATNDRERRAAGPRRRADGAG
jgi:flagellar basal-body rod protein FlgB